jgi:hypothetical protein
MVVTRICDRCEKVIGDSEYWLFKMVKANDKGVIPRTDKSNELCESCYADFQNWLKGETQYVEKKPKGSLISSLQKSITKG